MDLSTMFQGIPFLLAVVVLILTALLFALKKRKFDAALLISSGASILVIATILLNLDNIPSQFNTALIIALAYVLINIQEVLSYIDTGETSNIKGIKELEKLKTDLQQTAQQKIQLEQKVKELETSLDTNEKEYKEKEDKMSKENEQLNEQLRISKKQTRIPCPNCKQLLEPSMPQGVYCVGIHPTDGDITQYQTRRKTFEQEFRCTNCNAQLHLDLTK